MTGLGIGFMFGVLVVILAIRLAMDTVEDMAPLPAPPEMLRDDEFSHDALFRPRRWVRARQPAMPDVGPVIPEQYDPHAVADHGHPAEVPEYHRPLDIEALPDDAIMPPPRRIRGVNRER